MNIDFGPEDIENYVKNSLIKSSIGKVIDDAIRRILNPQYGTGEVEAQLRIVVKEIATEVIREKFSSSVKVCISEMIEKMVTQDMLEKVTKLAVEKMAKSIEDEKYW